MRKINKTKFVKLKKIFEKLMAFNVLFQNLNLAIRKNYCGFSTFAEFKSVDLKKP